MPRTIPFDSNKTAGVGRRRSPRNLSAIVLVAYLTALALSTHMPTASLPIRITNDVACHFVAYFGLGVVVWLALVAKMRFTVATSCAAWALVAALGVLDETTQPWFGRAFQWKDIAADSIGAACATAIAHVRYRWVIGRHTSITHTSGDAPIVPRRRHAA